MKMVNVNTNLQSARPCNGSYNGISVQPTWEEQVEYLRNEKIAKYKNHYIARYVGGKIVEVWKLDGMDVFNILLPKLKRGFESTKNRKDPRLGASLTQKEIILMLWL